jgi:prepilin peptidase CpaA
LELVTGLLLSVFPALMITAALSDVTSMTIPNRISAALILAFFPTAWMVGLPIPVVLSCLGVGLAGLVIGMVMFALRWIGGGDAKLMAAAALWLGVSGAPAFLMWTAVAGGVFAVSLMMVRSAAQTVILPYVASAPRWVGRLLEPKGAIPYGVAIAAGGLVAFLESPLLKAFSGLF